MSHCPELKARVLDALTKRTTTLRQVAKKHCVPYNTVATWNFELRRPGYYRTYANLTRVLKRLT